MHSLILSQCSDLRMDVSFNHNTYKTVLNLLEAIYSRLRKTVLHKVTVVKFGVESEQVRLTERRRELMSLVR